eukprot:gene6253-9236_t
MTTEHESSSDESYAQSESMDLTRECSDYGIKGFGNTPTSLDSNQIMASFGDNNYDGDEEEEKDKDNDGWNETDEPNSPHAHSDQNLFAPSPTAKGVKLLSSSDKNEHNSKEISSNQSLNYILDLSSSSQNSSSSPVHQDATMEELKGTDLGDELYGEGKIWQLHPEDPVNVVDLVTGSSRRGRLAPRAKNLVKWIVERKTWWVANEENAPNPKKPKSIAKEISLRPWLMSIIVDLFTDPRQDELESLVILCAAENDTSLQQTAKEITEMAQKGENALRSGAFSDAGIFFRKAQNELENLEFTIRKSCNN